MAIRLHSAIMVASFHEEVESSRVESSDVWLRKNDIPHDEVGPHCSAPHRPLLGPRPQWFPQSAEKPTAVRSVGPGSRTMAVEQSA